MNSRTEQAITKDIPLTADIIEAMLATPNSPLKADFNAICSQIALLKESEKERFIQSLIRTSIESKREMLNELAHANAIREKAWHAEERHIQDLVQRAAQQRLAESGAGFTSRVDIMEALTKLALQLDPLRQTQNALQNAIAHQQQVVQQWQNLQQQFATDMINQLTAQTITLNDGSTVSLALTDEEASDLRERLESEPVVTEVLDRLPHVAEHLNQLAENKLNKLREANTEIAPQHIIQAKQEAAQEMHLTDEKPLHHRLIKIVPTIANSLKRKLGEDKLQQIKWEKPKRGIFGNINDIVNNMQDFKALRQKIHDMTLQCIAADIQEKHHRNEYNKCQNATEAVLEQLASLLMKEPQHADLLKDILKTAFPAPVSDVRPQLRI